MVIYQVGISGPRVPALLILDRKLSPVAKLIWVVLRQNRDRGPISLALLERRSGLSRPTLRKGLAELSASEWHPAVRTRGEARSEAVASAFSGAGVLLPAALVGDRRVTVRGRLLYGHLQLTLRFTHPTGHFIHAQLAKQSGAGLNTVKRALDDLVASGWLETTQQTRRAPVPFTLLDPFVARVEVEIARTERQLEGSRFLGEALMRAYLSLLVDSEAFEDNATPGFLVNPLTGEGMQFDRFYPPDVAFEFNGPQHYGATERFSEATAAGQRARDYMKLGICAERGIRLVVIHPEDLTLETMRRKIDPSLPRRDLTGHEALIAHLESVGRRYRLAARRGRRLDRAARRSDPNRAAERSDAARFYP